MYHHFVNKDRAKYLRKHMTRAELHLWKYLRNRNIAGYKFRRQHPLKYFIVDFYCADAKLIIEVDGGSHKEKEAADHMRDAFMAKYGYRTIRFSNHEVEHELPGVLEVITKTLK